MSRLRLNRTIALILIFVIAASFAGLILQQKTAAPLSINSQSASESAMENGIHYNLLSFPMSTNSLSVFLTRAVPQVSFAEAPALNNSTRAEIYDFVKANPGANFRAICNGLGLSIGLAQFHLGVLTRAGLVSFFRDGKYKRFFQSNRFSKKQIKIMSLLRHKTAGDILRNILERKQVSHSELAHELSVTSQGLTWQMNRLEKEGIVQENKQGMKVIYSLETTYAPVVTEMMAFVEKNLND
jgi:DNA-binding transcriptional ArsR family regulator